MYLLETWNRTTTKFEIMKVLKFPRGNGIVFGEGESRELLLFIIGVLSLFNMPV